MTALWFGSSRVEEGDSRRRTARRRAPEGRRCHGEPKVGDDTLVGRTGPKGRAERAGSGGSEGETKMGQATKWAESQGGCNINSFFFEF
jgi:hypothetical protein